MRASARSSGKGLYYFDLVAAVLAAMIAAGYLGVIRHPLLSGYAPAAASALFVAALVALGLNRGVAYTQKTPWLVGLFAVTAICAIVSDFRTWGLPWLVLLTGAASILLVFGLVVRARPVAEGLSRLDFFKLGAIGFGVLFAIALSEGVLRLATGLFSPETQQRLRADPANYGVAHPYIGYLHRPNHTIVFSGRDFHASAHVDGLGFRNAWPWPDRADVVVTGDSVTFGYGVEDDQAWPAILQREASNTKLINLALIGGGPQQYQRLFETFGVGLRPKLVLVGLFVRNDFWDAQMFDRWEKSGAGENYLVWRDFGRTEPLRISLAEPIASLRSLFAAAIAPAVKRSRIYRLLHVLEGENDAMFGGVRTFVCADGGKLQLMPGDFASKAALGEPGSREFGLTVEAMRRLDELAKRNGGHALTIFLPGKEEVYLPLLGEQVPDPTRGLREAFNRLGIDYLDLGPAFRRHAASGERLFFELDGHPNPAGYALIAQLVLSHITQNSGQYGLTEPRLQQ